MLRPQSSTRLVNDKGKKDSEIYLYHRQKPLSVKRCIPMGVGKMNGVAHLDVHASVINLNKKPRNKWKGGESDWFENDLVRKGVEKVMRESYERILYGDDSL